MNTRAILACTVVLAITMNSQAAKLVVLAVNSGNGTTDGAQPPIIAGAKGFLIGIDNTNISPGEPAVAPLAFQNLTFSGTTLVQRLAPNAFANGDLDSPHVRIRSQALLANIVDPVAGSTFAANDSWWWNQVQNGLTLSPVIDGLQGGLPGGPMTYTASFNLSGSVPRQNNWRLAYIVATGDVQISGILASGPNGFHLGSGDLVPDNMKNEPQTTTLDFESGKIGVLIPEPSAFVLAGIALAGLAVGGWMRRGKDGRLR